MRGKTHEHEHAAHEHHRKRGGHVKKHKAEGGEIMKAGGNPEVEREAEEKKHGGKVHHHEKKRAHGGKAEHHKKEHHHERKRGGHVVEGKEMKHRMDRPGRKRGGKVGADTSPLSSAHHASDNPGHQPATQQGGMSD